MARQLSEADYRRLLRLRVGLRRFLRWSEEEAARTGLTTAQHQLLLAVRGHPGPEPPTIGEIAGYLMLRHHSAVGLVDRAERAGLVERRPDARDHRVVRLVLSAEGARLLGELSALHLEELERLGAEMQTLWQGLEARPGPG